MCSDRSVTVIRKVPHRNRRNDDGYQHFKPQKRTGWCFCSKVTAVFRTRIVRHSYGVFETIEI